MKLFLVRHGETSWNRKMLFLSHTDISLTRKGIQQAVIAAQTLKTKKIEQCYSSDMKRCLQTAEQIAKHLTLKINIVPELREAHFGIFEGLTLKEIEIKHPKFFRERKNDKWNFRIPHGESYKDASKRVAPIIKKIMKDGKNTVVVTHAIIIKIILKMFTSFSLEQIEKHKFAPGEIVIVEIENNKIKLKKPNLT